MIYKFKLGDKVISISSGQGLGPEEIGKVFTITEKGIYVGAAGYKNIPFSR